MALWKHNLKQRARGNLKRILIVIKKKGIYINTLPDQVKLMSQDQIMEILEKTDSNKDGRYTNSELKKALKDLRSYVPGWKVMHCLTTLDANIDGQISSDEIDNLIDYLPARGFGKN